MGSKRFLGLNDFVRFELDIHVSCANGHCGHHGVVGAYDCWTWFRMHRWPCSLDDANLYRRFRCSRCRAHAGRLAPTEQAVTVVDFFPGDDRGWKALERRLRG